MPPIAIIPPVGRKINAETGDGDHENAKALPLLGEGF
jgi:hypothetical protein